MKLNNSFNFLSDLQQEWKQQPQVALPQLLQRLYTARVWAPDRIDRKNSLIGRVSHWLQFHTERRQDMQRVSEYLARSYGVLLGDKDKLSTLDATFQARIVEHLKNKGLYGSILTDANLPESTASYVERLRSDTAKQYEHKVQKRLANSLLERAPDVAVPAPTRDLLERLFGWKEEAGKADPEAESYRDSYFAARGWADQGIEQRRKQIADGLALEAARTAALAALGDEATDWSEIASMATQLQKAVHDTPHAGSYLYCGRYGSPVDILKAFGSLDVILPEKQVEQLPKFIQESIKAGKLPDPEEFVRNNVSKVITDLRAKLPAGSEELDAVLQTLLLQHEFQAPDAYEKLPRVVRLHLDMIWKTSLADVGARMAPGPLAAMFEAVAKYGDYVKSPDQRDAASASLANWAAEKAHAGYEKAHEPIAKAFERMQQSTLASLPIELLDMLGVDGIVSGGLTWVEFEREPAPSDRFVVKVYSLGSALRYHDIGGNGELHWPLVYKGVSAKNLNQEFFHRLLQIQRATSNKVEGSIDVGSLYQGLLSMLGRQPEVAPSAPFTEQTVKAVVNGAKQVKQKVESLVVGAQGLADKLLGRPAREVGEPALIDTTAPVTPAVMPSVPTLPWDRVQVGAYDLDAMQSLLLIDARVPMPLARFQLRFDALRTYYQSGPDLTDKATIECLRRACAQLTQEMIGVAGYLTAADRLRYQESLAHLSALIDPPQSEALGALPKEYADQLKQMIPASLSKENLRQIGEVLSWTCGDEVSGLVDTVIDTIDPMLPEAPKPQSLSLKDRLALGVQVARSRVQSWVHGIPFNPNRCWFQQLAARTTWLALASHLQLLYATVSVARNGLQSRNQILLTLLIHGPGFLPAEAKEWWDRVVNALTRTITQMFLSLIWWAIQTPYAPEKLRKAGEQWSAFAATLQTQMLGERTVTPALDADAIEGIRTSTAFTLQDNFFLPYTPPPVPESVTKTEGDNVVPFEAKAEAFASLGLGFDATQYPTAADFTTVAGLLSGLRTAREYCEREEQLYMADTSKKLYDRAGQRKKDSYTYLSTVLRLLPLPNRTGTTLWDQITPTQRKEALELLTDLSLQLSGLNRGLHSPKSVYESRQNKFAECLPHDEYLALQYGVLATVTHMAMKDPEARLDGYRVKPLELHLYAHEIFTQMHQVEGYIPLHFQSNAYWERLSAVCDYFNIDPSSPFDHVEAARESKSLLFSYLHAHSTFSHVKELDYVRELLRDPLVIDKINQIPGLRNLTVKDAEQHITWDEPFAFRETHCLIPRSYSLLKLQVLLCQTDVAKNYTGYVASFKQRGTHPTVGEKLTYAARDTFQYWDDKGSIQVKKSVGQDEVLEYHAKIAKHSSGVWSYLPVALQGETNKHHDTFSDLFWTHPRYLLERGIFTEERLLDDAVLQGNHKRRVIKVTGSDLQVSSQNNTAKPRRNTETTYRRSPEDSMPFREWFIRNNWSGPSKEPGPALPDSFDPTPRVVDRMIRSAGLARQLYPKRVGGLFVPAYTSAYREYSREPMLGETSMARGNFCHTLTPMTQAQLIACIGQQREQDAWIATVGFVPVRYREIFSESGDTAARAWAILLEKSLKPESFEYLVCALGRSDLLAKQLQSSPQFALAVSEVFQRLWDLNRYSVSNERPLALIRLGMQTLESIQKYAPQHSASFPDLRALLGGLRTELTNDRTEKLIHRCALALLPPPSRDAELDDLAAVLSHYVDPECRKTNSPSAYATKPKCGEAQWKLGAKLAAVLGTDDETRKEVLRRALLILGESEIDMDAPITVNPESPLDIRWGRFGFDLQEKLYSARHRSVELTREERILQEVTQLVKTELKMLDLPLKVDGENRWTTRDVEVTLNEGKIAIRRKLDNVWHQYLGHNTYRTQISETQHRMLKAEVVAIIEKRADRYVTISENVVGDERMLTPAGTAAAHPQLAFLSRIAPLESFQCWADPATGQIALVKSKHLELVGQEVNKKWRLTLKGQNGVYLAEKQSDPNLRSLPNYLLFTNDAGEKKVVYPFGQWTYSASWRALQYLGKLAPLADKMAQVPVKEDVKLCVFDLDRQGNLVSDSLADMMQTVLVYLAAGDAPRLDLACKALERALGRDEVTIAQLDALEDDMLMMCLVPLPDHTLCVTRMRLMAAIEQARQTHVKAESGESGAAAVSAQILNPAEHKRLIASLGLLMKDLHSLTASDSLAPDINAFQEYLLYRRVARYLDKLIGPRLPELNWLQLTINPTETALHYNRNHEITLGLKQTPAEILRRGGWMGLMEMLLPSSLAIRLGRRRQRFDPDYSAAVSLGRVARELYGNTYSLTNPMQWAQSIHRFALYGPVAGSMTPSLIDGVARTVHELAPSLRRDKDANLMHALRQGVTALRHAYLTAALPADVLDAFQQPETRSIGDVPAGFTWDSLREQPALAGRYFPYLYAVANGERTEEEQRQLSSAIQDKNGEGWARAFQMMMRLKKDGVARGWTPPSLLEWITASGTPTQWQALCRDFEEWTNGILPHGAKEAARGASLPMQGMTPADFSWEALVARPDIAGEYFHYLYAVATNTRTPSEFEDQMQALESLKEFRWARALLCIMSKPDSKALPHAKRGDADRWKQPSLDKWLEWATDDKLSPRWVAFQSNLNRMVNSYDRITQLPLSDCWDSTKLTPQKLRDHFAKFYLIAHGDGTYEESRKLKELLPKLRGGWDRETAYLVWVLEVMCACEGLPLLEHLTQKQWLLPTLDQWIDASTDSEAWQAMCVSFHKNMQVGLSAVPQLASLLGLRYVMGSVDLLTGSAVRAGISTVVQGGAKLLGLAAPGQDVPCLPEQAPQLAESNTANQVGPFTEAEALSADYQPDWSTGFEGQGDAAGIDQFIASYNTGWTSGWTSRLIAWAMPGVNKAYGLGRLFFLLKGELKSEAVPPMVSDRYTFLDKLEDQVDGIYASLFDVAFEKVDAAPGAASKRTVEPLALNTSDSVHAERAARFNKSLEDHYANEARGDGKKIKLRSAESLVQLLAKAGALQAQATKQLDAEVAILLEFVNRGKKSNALYTQDKILTEQDLDSFFLRGNLSNPGNSLRLPPEVLRIVDEAVADIAIRRARLDHQLGQLVKNLEKIQAKFLAGDLLATDPLIEAVAQQLISPRFWRASSVSPRMERVLLIFSKRTGIEPWNIQIERWTKWLEDDGNSMIEWLMGLGKSSFGIPAGGKVDADGQTTVLQIWPEQLISPMVRDVGKTLHQLDANSVRIRIDRDMPLEKISGIVQLHRQAKLNGNTIHMSRWDAAGVELTLIDLLHKVNTGQIGNTEEAESAFNGLKEILANYRFGKTVAYMDEGHELYDYEKELNWPVGAEQVIDAHTYAAIEEAMVLLLQDKCFADRVAQNKATLTKEDFQSKIAPAIAAQLADQPTFRIDADQREDFILWVTGQSAKAPSWLQNHRERTSINMVRGVLLVLTPMCLLKAANVDFGKSKTKDIKFAKPFAGNDSECESSLIQNPYEGLVKTFLMYGWDGLEVADVDSTLRIVLQNATAEASAQNRNSADTNSGKLFAKITGVTPDEWEWSMCGKNEIRRHPQLIGLYVRHFVRKEVKFWAKSARSNGINFGSLFKNQRTDTGTPFNDGMLPAHVKMKWDPGTTGKAVATITEKLVDENVTVLKAEEPVAVLDEILHEYFQPGSGATMIMDGGALQRGVSNEQAAKRMWQWKLDTGRDDIQAITFFDKEGNQMSYEGPGRIIARDASQVGVHNRWTYFGQPQGFGANEPQPDDSETVVSFGEASINYKLVQQFFRHRAIKRTSIMSETDGKVPRLRVVTTKSVKNIVAPDSDSLHYHKMWEYSVKKEADLVSNAHYDTTVQRMHNVPRDQVIRKILKSGFREACVTARRAEPILLESFNTDPNSLYGCEKLETTDIEALQGTRDSILASVNSLGLFSAAAKEKLAAELDSLIANRPTTRAERTVWRTPEGAQVDVDGSHNRQVTVAVQQVANSENSSEQQNESQQENQSQNQLQQKNMANQWTFTEWKWNTQTDYSNPNWQSAARHNTKGATCPIIDLSHGLENSSLPSIQQIRNRFDSRLWFSNNWLPQYVTGFLQSRVDLGSSRQRPLNTVLVYATETDTGLHIDSVGAISITDKTFFEDALRNQPAGRTTRAFLWDVELACPVGGDSVDVQQLRAHADFQQLLMQMRFVDGRDNYPHSREYLEKWIKGTSGHWSDVTDMIAANQAICENRTDRSLTAHTDLDVLFRKFQDLMPVGEQ